MLGVDSALAKIRPKVRQVIGWSIRNRQVFARIPGNDAYLEIGCGPNIRDEVATLDWEWRPGLDICWDITSRLPMKDESIAGIFTEHCLEHIEFKQCHDAAREMYRILKPGGHIRVVVPDAELYFANYRTHRDGGEACMPYAETDSIGGIYTPMMSINRIMHDHGHRFIYDSETMAALLESVGFRDVTKRAFGEGADPKLLMDTPSRAVESLYVEARK